MSQQAGNSFAGIKLRSVDGSAVWIASDSLTDYVLHPVFLRFLAIAVLLVALLDQRPALQPLGGWALTFLWSTVACVTMGLIVLSARLLSALASSGRVKQVYTPVLLVPIALCAEFSLQAGIFLLDGSGSFDLGQSLQSAARNLLVAGLLDLLHASFVVHAHPLAQFVANPQLPTGSEPVAPGAATPPLALAPEPVSHPDTRPEPTLFEGGMVQIGPTQLPLGSILLIRTEDHYLGVTTRTGKALHRAKMADIPELHAGQFGMQVNRSVWIAYSAVKDVVESENRQVIVLLVTGDEERVSKPRVFAFRQSYAKYLASHPAQS